MSPKKIIVIAIVTAITAGVWAATPQVKNVRVFQQYPWDGKIRISYEVVGNITTGTGSGLAPFLFVSARDKTTGQIYGGASLGESCLSGDTGTATGCHIIVWDALSQGLSFNSNNVVISVVYCDELYVVVDLSSGASASSYPISYLYAVPSGGWSDTYMTTKLVLKRIPAGTFKMQNTANVTLTKPFYIGVFEVTQRQWELVTGSNPCYGASFGWSNTFPVHNVSYDMIRGSSNGAKWPSSSAVDSDSFMGRLRARTGLNFDLPTEAQWEYACRAGTTTTYYWGDSKNSSYSYAWYNGNSSSRPHWVGEKTPNAWGLYDMSGNVWEWCLDWWGSLKYGTNPKGPSSGSTRVWRGGGWSNSADSCTSSSRYGDFSPSLAVNYIGFRLARPLSN